MILDILRILSVVTAFYCMCLSVRVLVFVSAALYLVANIMYEAGGIKVDNFISILYRQDFIIVFFAFLGFQKRRLKELKGLPVIAYEYRGKITSGKQN